MVVRMHNMIYFPNKADNFSWRSLFLFAFISINFFIVSPTHAAMADSCILTKLANRAMTGNAAALTQLKNLSSGGNALAQALVAQYGLFRNQSFKTATPAERRATIKLLKASAKSGNALGMYLYGREILKSDKSKSGTNIQVKAKDLLENAVPAMVTEGHKKCGAPYQFWLAVAYLQGLGVEKDSHKAFIWLERSAKNDFLPAQGWLGQTLVMGAWIPRDCKRGLGLLKENSAAGFELSTNMLGYAYEYGFCVGKSQHTAVKYYKQAIKSNLKTAYYNLGMSYVNGEGVPQNIAKGFSLLDEAAIRGYSPAARMSRVVGEYMIAKRIIDDPISIPSNQRNVLNKQRALSLLADAAKAGFEPAKAELEAIKKNETGASG